MSAKLTFAQKLHRLAEAAAFLGVFCTLAPLLGGSIWFMDFFSHFKPQLALCFAVWAAFEFLIRHRGHALASLVAATINAVPVLLLLVPVSGATGTHAPHPAAHIRILQANVLTCNTNTPALLALVRTENPDVVVLQEPDAWWLRQLSPLTNAYPVYATLPRDDNFGAAIYCKSNALSADIFHLDDPETAPSTHARIAVNGRVINVVGTHTLAPYTDAMWKGRNAFTQELAKKLRKIQGPLVVSGDFNNTPWSPHFRDFLEASGLHDSSQGHGYLPTWPAFSAPLLRIPLDHCFYSDGVTILSKRMGPDIGSDHRPLIIDAAF